MRCATVFLGVMAFAALAARIGSAQGTVNYWEYIDASEGIFMISSAQQYDEPVCHRGGLYLDQHGRHDKLDATGYQRSIDRRFTNPRLDDAHRFSAERSAHHAGTPATSTLLLSSSYDSYTGGSTALGDITDEGNGILFDANGTPYAVPGASDAGPYQFQVLTWTGTQYTTYAAAVGQPNTYTGRSRVYREHLLLDYASDA